MLLSCGRRAGGGAQQSRCQRAFLVLLFAGLVATTGAHAEVPASRDAYWSTWLRRAMAPSAQSGAKQPIPTSVACAAWAEPDMGFSAQSELAQPVPASRGTEDGGCEDRMQGCSISRHAGARQREHAWVQRAFAPSATPNSRARVLTVQSLAPAQQKLSRVTVDQAAGEDEMRFLTQTAPTQRQLMAMRGGGVEHVFDRTSSTGRTRFPSGISESTVGANVRTRSAKQGHRGGLAFLHGDSSIIGSRGCSRDWRQLVKSTAPAAHFESAREAACGRSSGLLVRYSVRSRSPSRERPYRLSRTVEDTELPTSCRATAPQ